MAQGGEEDDELNGVGRIRRREVSCSPAQQQCWRSKSVIERDGEPRKGMNGPWHPSPSPRKQSGSSSPSAFFFLRLGAVFIQQLKQLRSCIFIQGMAGGTLVQNDLLPLEVDVFGPFDETGEVSLGSDVLACGPS